MSTYTPSCRYQTAWEQLQNTWCPKQNITDTLISHQSNNDTSDKHHHHHPVSTQVIDHPRYITDAITHDAVNGVVTWNAKKSAWMTVHTIIAIVGGLATITDISAIALFLTTTATSLCLGHSLGMHRRLIHRSYACPKWLEYAFVHLGTLVGMAGPIGMIRTHDIRDWAQRQPVCHDYLCHRNSMPKDAFWQVHCDLSLTSGPRFSLEPLISNDGVYRWMEKYWMAQQLPWAMLFYAIGGWSWVIWGICARVAVCVHGHWLVGYFAHRPSPISSRTWHVSDAGVQGYNVRVGRFTELMSFGESHHNNHHAFPGSARLGLYPGEWDFGWVVLKALERVGLVWNLVTPANLPPRASLQRVHRH